LTKSEKADYYRENTGSVDEYQSCIDVNAECRIQNSINKGKKILVVKLNDFHSVCLLKAKKLCNY